MAYLDTRRSRVESAKFLWKSLPALFGGRILTLFLNGRDIALRCPRWRSLPVGQRLGAAGRRRAGMRRTADGAARLPYHAGRAPGSCLQRLAGAKDPAKGSSGRPNGAKGG